MATKTDRASKSSAFHGRYCAHGASASGFYQPLHLNHAHSPEQAATRALSVGSGLGEGGKNRARYLSSGSLKSGDRRACESVDLGDAQFANAGSAHPQRPRDRTIMAPGGPPSPDPPGGEKLRTRRGASTVSVQNGQELFANGGTCRGVEDRLFFAVNHYGY
jgi:hypothetical protein